VGFDVSEKSGKRTSAEYVAAIAAAHADNVDLKGRFPLEAVNAMRSERLLGIQVPTAFGGEGASITETAEICSILGQACAASAMIFAMHQIKVTSLIAHSNDSAWHLEFMRKLAVDQLLVASATTEAGIGGNIRNSVCAIDVKSDMCSLTKDATVISYGAYADAIMATSRVNESAASTDQVMTVFKSDQYTLERTVGWDALGMRGTCSEGFLFKGQAPVAQIFPRPFAEIAAQSMLASSHLLWSAVWYGIAVDAVLRAQAFVRSTERKPAGNSSLASVRLAEATNLLQLLKSNIRFGLITYENARLDPSRLSSMTFPIAMNNVKLAASEIVFSVINHAMIICGIMGYKNGTPYSLGRHLRDACSAQLMISNERILVNTSNLLLVQRPETSLLD
jgi:acyl-CoA dehydrogenase